MEYLQTLKYCKSDINVYNGNLAAVWARVTLFSALNKLTNAMSIIRILGFPNMYWS